MKHSISLKQLTLLAGIVVALIVVFLLISSNQFFTAHVPSPGAPSVSLATVGKIAFQKISVLF
jgi:hypothetical protein